MSYIRQYTELTQQELRQLRYKRQYKERRPTWDDSMVLLTNLVKERTEAGKGSLALLDFGCGRGNFVVDELRDRFSRTVGFDLDRDATVGNVSMDEVVIGSPDRLPFADASFDAVVSLWVLEHVEHPEQVFQEIARVLKPGGCFAFVTPHKKSALIAVRRFLTDGMAHHLLRVLYGREEKDVFPVFYRANSVRDLKRIADGTSLQPDILVENDDPSYTSFNSFTFWFSCCFARWGGPFAKPHLVGVLRKEATGKAENVL